MPAHIDCCAGLWRHNPLLSRVLGVCPLLAMSDRVVTAVAIGVSFALVYVWTMGISSAAREVFPPQVRLVCHAIIAACGVTLLHLVLEAWFFELERELGIYLPVLAGCCLILARAEEGAVRQPVLGAVRESLVYGSGAFVLVVTIAFLRELLAYGTLFRDAYLLWPALDDRSGIALLPAGWSLPIAAMPAGALLVFAGVLALHRALTASADGHT